MPEIYRLLSAVMAAWLSWTLYRGVVTGHIFLTLMVEGDRKASPLAFWAVMLTVGGCVLAFGYRACVGFPP